MFDLGGFEIALTLGALVVGGFLKGITGLGLPLIITPPLVIVFGIQAAVPIVAITAMITNIIFISKYRYAWREVLSLWPIVVWGLIAIIVGVVTLQYADQNMIAILLSILAISYVVISFLGIEMAVHPSKLKIFGPLMGIVAGFFHGTTGISGPPIVAYLTSIKDLSRAAYFQGMGCIFLIFGMQQILGYTITGLYSKEIIKMGCLTCIPVIISFYLGNYFQHKLDATIFKRITLMLILVSSLNLLIHSI